MSIIIIIVIIIIIIIRCQLRSGLQKFPPNYPAFLLCLLRHSVQDAEVRECGVSACHQTLHSIRMSFSHECRWQSSDGPHGSVRFPRHCSHADWHAWLIGAWYSWQCSHCKTEQRTEDMQRRGTRRTWESCQDLRRNVTAL